MGLVSTRFADGQRILDGEVVYGHISTIEALKMSDPLKFVCW